MGKIIGISFLLILFLSSCVKEEQAFTTFKGEMVYTFLEKDTTYSEFVKVLDRAGLIGMLSAYGDYTCLAPTNQALRRYYKEMGSTFTINNLTEGQIDSLAKTHILQNRYLTSNLSQGVMPSPNMNKRVIEIRFDENGRILLNDSSQIIWKDNEVYNGVVHGIDRVLSPSNVQLPNLIAANPNISIFSKALTITGLCDSIAPILDLNYKPTMSFKDPTNTFVIVNPDERRYSYSVLVEDDELLSANGINNLTDLIQRAKELYPTDSKYNEDYKDRNNSLNRYISYHMINKAIYLNKFFYTRNTNPGYAPDEFLETMLPLRLIRASRINAQITLNPNTRHSAHVKETGGSVTVNGVYHLLDNMLVYTQDVELMLQNTRIRFDASSLFPELTNNNIRCVEGVMKSNNSQGDRFGFEPGYLSNIKMSKDSRLVYMAGINGQFSSFQADFFSVLGIYDVTIRLLPVPPGTYELRYPYSAWPQRGICQIYIDNKPVGIPLNLMIPADDPRIGWLLDANTDDNGFENDKTMRNRGYMKGPNTIWWGKENKSQRNSSTNLLRIIGTFSFDKYEIHTIRFKSVTNDVQKEAMLDYFEFVPKSIYNPASGEPEGRD